MSVALMQAMRDDLRDHERLDEQRFAHLDESLAELRAHVTRIHVRSLCAVLSVLMACLGWLATHNVRIEIAGNDLPMIQLQAANQLPSWFAEPLEPMPRGSTNVR